MVESVGSATLAIPRPGHSQKTMGSPESPALSCTPHAEDGDFLARASIKHRHGLQLGANRPPIAGLGGRTAPGTGRWALLRPSSELLLVLALLSWCRQFRGWHAATMSESPVLVHRGRAFQVLIFQRMADRWSRGGRGRPPVSSSGSHRQTVQGKGMP